MAATQNLLNVERNTGTPQLYVLRIHGSVHYFEWQIRKFSKVVRWSSDAFTSEEACRIAGEIAFEEFLTADAVAQKQARLDAHAARAAVVQAQADARGAKVTRIATAKAARMEKKARIAGSRAVAANQDEVRIAEFQTA